jgi:hypothetical protein
MEGPEGRKFRFRAIQVSSKKRVIQGRYIFSDAIQLKSSIYSVTPYIEVVVPAKYKSNACIPCKIIDVGTHTYFHKIIYEIIYLIIYM